MRVARAWTTAASPSQALIERNTPQISLPRKPFSNVRSIGSGGHTGEVPLRPNLNPVPLVPPHCANTKCCKHECCFIGRDVAQHVIAYATTALEATACLTVEAVPHHTVQPAPDTSSEDRARYRPFASCTLLTLSTPNPDPLRLAKCIMLALSTK